MMFLQFFQDRWKQGSAKRFAGILGFFAFTGMVVAAGCGAPFSETLILGGLTICAGLLSATVFERATSNEQLS